jgi:hypothetical protein
VEERFQKIMRNQKSALPKIRSWKKGFVERCRHCYPELEDKKERRRKLSSEMLKPFDL